MIDVINALNNLVPSAQYEGTVEYERPILTKDGFGTGEFESLPLKDVQELYEALRWNDSRPQPTWDEIVAYDAANPPLKPLMERLTSLINQLTPEQQASLGNVIAPAYVALTTGRPGVAKLIIEAAPVTADLQALKDAILTEFNT